MCIYCGATQVEEVNGRIICSYCRSPLDDKKDNKWKDDVYYNMFKGCAILGLENYET